MMTKRFALYSLPKREAKPPRKYFLTPIELKDYGIDFEVKRVYFVTQPETETGEHCHYEEKEFFIMVAGTGTAVIDQGNGREEIALTAPTSAIYVPNYVWHGFKNLSKDAIFLALSSTNYDPSRNDYLEDYDEYLKIRDQHLAK
jgi:mannose-6-phosphate isomerase-like protein (cupin superfamily)